MCGRQVRRGAVWAYNLVYRFTFSNLDIKAAWSYARPWRRACSCDASRSARVSQRVLPGISTYPSCANSRLTRGGIGAGEFVIGVGVGGIVAAGVGARAGTGVGVVAGAGAGVLEREQARRRSAQALASVCRCPPGAQWADFRLQLPEGSKTHLDDATPRHVARTTFPVSASSSLWQSCPRL